MGYHASRNDSATPEESSSEDQRVGRAGVLVASGREVAPSMEAPDRHIDGPMAALDHALHEPTAREVASAYLHGAVRVGTRTDTRHGDPSIQRALGASHAGRPTREAESNEHGVARIVERLQHAKQAGDLPRDADPHLLARYLTTLSDGIAVEADGGAAADELHAVADVALQAWLFP